MDEKLVNEIAGLLLDAQEKVMNAPPSLVKRAVELLLSCAFEDGDPTRVPWNRVARVVGDLIFPWQQILEKFGIPLHTRLRIQAARVALALYIAHVLFGLSNEDIEKSMEKSPDLLRYLDIIPIPPSNVPAISRTFDDAVDRIFTALADAVNAAAEGRDWPEKSYPPDPELN